MAEHMSTAQPSRLRHATLILAIVLVGQLGFQHVSFSTLALRAFDNLASVSSATASITPNEYNTLAEQFSEKDKQLTGREQELLAREKALDEKYQAEIAATRRTTLFTILGATLVLVLLILANFYFDIKREEERERALLAQVRKAGPTSL